MRQIMVRYSVKPERTDENEQLIRDVYAELHTADISSACGFYSSLLRWRVERISAGAASYHALEMGRGLGGGVVECGASHPLWLPYVEVDRVDEVTERARRLGASVLLE